MATVPADIEGPSDAELIDAVRKGTVSAYGSLYERHVASAYNLARQLSRSPAEADDLVSEAFAKVLDTLRAGRGPDSAFRAYLLTALRHTAYDRTRRERRIELSDDVETAGGAKLAEPFSDTAVAGLERSLAAQAFARLPERWQAVLWHTEIEGQSPGEVAPILGLTPNGVSALAYRAREGLRQAYLQVHLAETTERRCRATAERLGAWTRSGLAKRERAQVEAHLDECERCRALAAELADINGAMRGFVAPLVLGVGAAGYLAAVASKGGALTAAGAAATAGGAAGGAGGAAGSAPRQFLGVAASGVVLAAVIAVGLTAGGGESRVPAAAPTPTQQPPAPTQAPAQPEPPAPPPAPPAPPPNEPPAQQQPNPPAPPEPAPEPGEPAPAPPNLTATLPSEPVALVAGGEPADLPITVRNSGETTSEPVTATLNLPPGVTAIPAGDRFGHEPMLRLNAARAGTVACPGGSGTVDCSSGQGLRSGESVTLLFRLVAAEGSTGGRITGSVSAGSTINVRVAVRVDVRPPAAVDAVVLEAEAEWLGLLPGIWLHPTLEARAENTGTSAKPITVTLDQPAQLIHSDHEMTCTVGGGTTCTTTAGIAPGETLTTLFELHPDPWPVKARDRSGKPRDVHVAAILGSARDSEVVRLRGWLWPVPPGILVPPGPPTGQPPTGQPPTGQPPSGQPPSGQPPTGQPPGSEQPASGSAETSSEPASGEASSTAEPTTSTRPPSPPTEPGGPPSSSPPERSGPSSPPPSGRGGLGGLLDWILGGGR
ncbi:sigma-70 family RNA polymerase sigma factor [Actinophytocola sp.]|uniref:sigma-70 family RNA polymerase sigma factor n=1 Tax=Actinophytocola sp. TaxID=1872138 RepID=UPI003D6C35CA